MSAVVNEQSSREAVLAKAVLRAALQLGLNQQELGAVLGLHRTAISRMNKGHTLKVESKEGELALLLIRVARALFALAGGDNDWIQHFMRSPNKITGDVPAEQIQHIQGLIRVLQFVDAIRGKV